MRLKTLEHSTVPRDGLPYGAVAPAFRLPLVGGGEVSLCDFASKRLLLVFSDPSCGPCKALAPRLGSLAQRTPDINILVVSRGSSDDNLQKAVENKWTFPIALQQNWEISREYAMFFTPIAYLIGIDGRISSEPAIGPDQIVNLHKAAAISALLND
jgi:peroxiredoxin